VKAVADRAGECWIEADEKLADELAKIGKAKGTRGQLRGIKPGKSRGRGKGSYAGGAVLALPAQSAPSLAEMNVNRKHAARAGKLRAMGRTTRKRIVDELKGEALLPVVTLSGGAVLVLPDKTPKAIRKGGRLLRQMREAGERAGRGQTVMSRRGTLPTLSDMSLTRNRASRWELAESLPQPQWNALTAMLPTR